MMWYGKDTKELLELNKKYRELFGVYPYAHMELEYGADEYEEYVNDIKKAIRIGKPLVDFVEQILPAGKGAMIWY